jgi:hypothetical protein
MSELPVFSSEKQEIEKQRIIENIPDIYEFPPFENMYELPVFSSEKQEIEKQRIIENTYELPVFSSEQQRIIENIGNKNVIVDAVAGSGKTTTSLGIAKQYPDKKILLLTYSKRLKLDTKEKIKKIKIKNIEAHSFHSFATKYLKSSYKYCDNDEKLEDSINFTGFSYPLELNYDIIIIDECQDMSILYFKLICLIFRNNKQKCNICILGDEKQNIFKYKNTDSRYLTEAPEIFNFNNLEFVRLKLSYTYRLPNTICSLVNYLCKENKMNYVKKSEYKPRYLLCDSFEYVQVYQEILNYIKEGYKPEDIFVLAPSVQGNKNPIKKLSNNLKIKNKDINIYVSSSDNDEYLDDDILRNKICFTTYHSVKGLERKVVIVFNFDSSYIKYYKKKDKYSEHYLFNEHYVALTRASERLTIIHDYKNEYLKIIDTNELSDYCEIIKTKEISVKTKEISVTRLLHHIQEDVISVSVTRLLHHIQADDINKLMKNVEIKIIQEKQKKIDIPSKTIQKNTSETISNINGIMIVSSYQYHKTKKMDIKENLKKLKENLKKRKHNFIIKNFDKFDRKENGLEHEEEENSIPEFLYISNCWICFSDDLIYKNKQIVKYDWFSEENLQKCHERLDKVLGTQFLIEYEVYTSTKKKELIFYDDGVEEKTYKIKGAIDYIDTDNTIIYEFKCVNELTKIHYLQLIVYKYIWIFHTKNEIAESIKYMNDYKQIEIEKNNKYNVNKINLNTERLEGLERDIERKKKLNQEYKFRVFNVLDNNIIEINVSDEELVRIIQELIYIKNNKKSKNTCTFLNEIETVKNKYYMQ